LLPNLIYMCAVNEPLPASTRLKFRAQSLRRSSVLTELWNTPARLSQHESSSVDRNFSFGAKQIQQGNQPVQGHCSWREVLLDLLMRPGDLVRHVEGT
jgi:hypothetical protein